MMRLQTRGEFLRCVALLAGGAALGCGKPDHVGPALRAAAGFLAARQSRDGAWRSAQSGAFRDGDALTPLVLRALIALPDAPTECLASGSRWLESLTAAQTARTEPWEGLRYPLFTASYSAQIFAHQGDARRAAFWAALIESLRLSPALNWPANSPACGAWGDAPAPPHLPPGEAAAPDMLAPNISATLLGLRALAAARRENRGAALAFLARCQNFATDGSDPPDDGGFFFAIDDPVRNKAGTAGRDAAGHERYRSYGSATCDGVLALAACGLAPDDPRMRAALAWLQRHAAGARHSGEWPAPRADEREALRYYHAQAFAAVLALAEKSAPLADWAGAQRRALTAELLASQRPDGAWEGTRPNSFEDDPLVATAFAMSALASAF